MTAPISWQPNATADLVIRHLVEGRAVVLPSESTYEVAVSGLRPEALAALPANRAIVLGAGAELFDWMPHLRGAGARLMRKLGPGPVVLRANGGFASGLWPRLPKETQAAVARGGLLAVRWPNHPIWNELRQSGLPLVTAAIPGAVTAESAAKLVGKDDAVIVDGGATQYGGVPTVIRVEGGRCLVEQPGVLLQEQIDELAACYTLFICTGNTCRSPLADAICKKLVADELGCSPDELKGRGFCVQSAGLAAMMGSDVSPDAAIVAADYGADLTQHKSRMVTMEMLMWADHLFAMTHGHCYTLESILVEGMTLPRMLSPNMEDIADPIGGALADYRTCAHQIHACLQARLPEFLES